MGELRTAVRTLLNHGAGSVTAIAILALGIGAGTFGFSVVDAVYLRPLPFADPAGTVMISWQTAEDRNTDVAFAEYAAWRDATRTLSGVAAFRERAATLGGAEGFAREVRLTAVTPEAFTLLGMAPRTGRGLTRSDGEAGAPPAVILSSAIWSARFNRDPGIVGRNVRVDGATATVIGVMPDGFAFPERTEIWMPLQAAAGDSGPVSMFGRLADDATRATSRTELEAIALSGSPFRALTPAGPAVAVQTFTESFIGGVGPSLFASILVTTLLVLLVACGNIGSLLLSRSVARSREVALRLALGSSRWRLVRQSLWEVASLTVPAGAIGLAAGVLALRVFAAATRDLPLPFWVSFTPDYRVAGFVVLLCVVTAVLVSLVPAAGLSRIDHGRILEGSGALFASGRRFERLTGGMLIVELTLTMALLGAAGLMIRSFLRLYVVDVGIAAEGLSALPLTLVERHAAPDARRLFYARLESALAERGVTEVSLATSVPPGDSGERLVEAEGSPGSARFVSTVAIDRRFLDLARRTIVRGGGFDGSAGSPATVLVNEELVARFFRGGDPIGRRIRFRTRGDTSPPGEWLTISGIAPPIRIGDSSDEYRNAAVFLPFEREWPATALLLVRHGGSPASLEHTLLSALQEVDRDQPAGPLRSVADVIADGRAFPRLLGIVFGVVAMVGLILSSVGTYAVAAFVVSQRTREVGIRLAVGARVGDIVRLILGRVARHLAAGLAGGVVGGVLLGILLRRMLVGVDPIDPGTHLTVALILTAAALLACLAPLARALRVDPVQVLRTAAD